MFDASAAEGVAKARLREPGRLIGMVRAFPISGEFTQPARHDEFKGMSTDSRRVDVSPLEVGLEMRVRVNRVGRQCWS